MSTLHLPCCNVASPKDISFSRKIKQPLSPSEQAKTHQAAKQCLAKAKQYESQGRIFRQNNNDQEALTAFYKAVHFYKLSNTFLKNASSKLTRDQQLDYLQATRELRKINVSKAALGQTNSFARNLKNALLHRKQVFKMDHRFEDGFRFYTNIANDRPLSYFSDGTPDFLCTSDYKAPIIVIDRENDPSLTAITENIKQQFLSRQADKRFEENLLIFKELITALFPKYQYEKSPQKGYDNYLDFKSDHYPHREIALGEFIQGSKGLKPGVGVCLEQALTAQVIGKELGFNIAFVAGMLGDGRHAWNEITAEDGTTYLFDPLNGVLTNTSSGKSLIPIKKSWQQKGLFSVAIQSLSDYVNRRELSLYKDFAGRSIYP